MNDFKRIFVDAYARYIGATEDTPAPSAIAAVTDVRPKRDLRCSCGTKAAQDFVFVRHGDGSASLTCRRCCAELAHITADLMTTE
jgi:hypothetical protein